MKSDLPCSVATHGIAQGWPPVLAGLVSPQAKLCGPHQPVPWDQVGQPDVPRLCPAGKLSSCLGQWPSQSRPHSRQKGQASIVRAFLTHRNLVSPSNLLSFSSNLQTRKLRFKGPSHPCQLHSRYAVGRAPRHLPAVFLPLSLLGFFF